MLTLLPKANTYNRTSKSCIKVVLNEPSQLQQLMLNCHKSSSKNLHLYLPPWVAWKKIKRKKEHD